MTRNNQGLYLSLTVIVGALSLAACGGGDGSDASEPSSSQAQQPAAPDALPPTANRQPALQDNYSPIGLFSAPFAEPTIVVDGEVVETDEKCITTADGQQECKPAAGTMALLPDNRILYLNALEGTENVELSIVAEFGEVSVNDQTRVLAIGDGDSPVWLKPAPLRGGANPDGNDSETLLGGTPLDGFLDTADNTSRNDGALFCSDVIGLADGSVMAVGGTDYYSEPGIDGLPLGVAELEGIRNSRIFDPKTNTWKQTGDMNFGRWYPSMVTLPDSKIFVASGVTKLLKPVYPEAPINSGRNVVQTETFDPCAGVWTQNPSTADRSLPLYPRLHLLPNGHVLYNAGGQAFNPFGQGYDQALWNIVATFDPAKQRWNDLGYAGLPLRLDEAGLGQLASTLNLTNLTQEQLTSFTAELLSNSGGLIESVSDLLLNPDDPVLEPDTLVQAIGGGMRGSTSSTMLPLKPDENGEYNDVELLTAGGVPSYALLTSPGGYLPTDQSRIDRVETKGDRIDYESRLTGPLTQPRWYGTNVVMPDGSVMVFSGGTRDGVVLPGLEGAILTAERFDPETETWTEMASGHRPRTYHNTAVLMADGRVMIGGHAPINTAYLSHISLEDFGLAPNDGRDPSFEIYTPPYALRNDRPSILSAPDQLGTGERFTIQVDQAQDIDRVMLIRRTVMTHLIDGDQRAIELPIKARNGRNLELEMPQKQSVIPAGQYMLFVSKPEEEGRVPSVSSPVQVVNRAIQCSADTHMAARDTVDVTHLHLQAKAS